ncbi:MAG: HU family DNA-binding protein [Bacteroidaceae bacterium]|jgi:predicted histone-like DNA-binding protein|nr:HU family DNA-binding protein [Bacteroidaceae bacterium]
MSLIKVKTRLTTIGFNKMQKYVTSPVRYSNITVDDLIKFASENSGISKANISASFFAIQQQIEQFVCNGHGIVLGNLGTFYISTRCKAADEVKDAGASSVKSLAVRFRQSKKLRTLLNNNTLLEGIEFEKDDEEDDQTDTPSGGDGEDNTSSGQGGNSEQGNGTDDQGGGDSGIG